MAYHTLDTVVHPYHVTPTEVANCRHEHDTADELKNSRRGDPGYYPIHLLSSPHPRYDKDVGTMVDARERRDAGGTSYDIAVKAVAMSGGMVLSPELLAAIPQLSDLYKPSNTPPELLRKVSTKGKGHGEIRESDGFQFGDGNSCCD